ncbi:hypothetical protein [Photorhabdus luminescens]|uniref:Preprotein translocase subunit SecD n=1 Tax=Photorhabdus luminescens subsp. mexicana TaxID=2100167 RepID=A0A4V2X6D1_PHOLU|nr:hypothetical protein [Photorhabdus luminescens]TDB51595.1 hypothetical protein C5468_11500 [Photorhabdus luminescens subsp. mexicana]
MRNLLAVMLLLSAITGCSSNPDKQVQREDGLKFAFSSGDKFILTRACTEQVDYLGIDKGGNNQLAIVVKKDKSCFPHLDALINKNIGTQVTVSFKGTPIISNTIQTALGPSFRMSIKDAEQAVNIVSALKN